MKLDNEIEKSKKRITLLEDQNALFKKLLDSALEVTNQSTSKTSLEKDENQFWHDTIELIENEKIKLQEDMNLLSETEDDMSLTVKKLQCENSELQKKIDILLNQVKLQEIEIKKLKTEHSEIKFLLSQPDSNSELFKNILKLDDSLNSKSSVLLIEERHKLQKRIILLEHKKTELLCAIEDITSPENTRKLDSEKIKSDLERALFKAIDEVAKREFETLHLRVLDLEKERSNLLNELQAVLDDSRKKIAHEYCNLQRKILEIEKEKAEFILSTKRSLNLEEDVSNEALDNVLDAFSNNHKTMLSKPGGKINLQETAAKIQYKFPAPTCTLL